MELYRYSRNYYGEFSSIDLSHFKVIRETEKCYVVEYFYAKSKIKYVLKCKCRNKFAWETKEAALQNFKLRTLRCIKIQRSQLRKSEMFLGVIENIKIN